MSDTADISVIFSADTGRFVAGVEGMDAALAKSSEEVARAKNAVLGWGEETIAAAKKAGASVEEQARIQERVAVRLANVTEANAQKMINSLGREADKAKSVAAELNRVQTTIKVQGGGLFSGDNEGLTDKQRASALIRGGGLRAAENFASQFDGFNKIATIAFPILGAATFATEIAHGVAELKEMYDTAKAIPTALSEGFEQVNAPLMLEVDNLRKSNDELEISIAHLEHQPANTLALALDEARINADKLAASANAAAANIKTLLDQNKVGFFGAAFLGESPTSVVADPLNGKMNQLRDLQRADRNALRSGKDTPQAAAARQARIGKTIDDLHQWAIDWQKQLGSDQQSDESANLNVLRGVEDYTANLQDQRSEQERNVRDQAHQKSLQDAEKQAADAKAAQEKATAATRKADEERLRAAEDFVSQWRLVSDVTSVALYDYWKAQEDNFTRGSSEFRAIQSKEAELAVEGARKAHELIQRYYAQEKQSDSLQAPDRNVSVLGNNEQSGREVQRAYATSNLSGAEDQAQRAKATLDAQQAAGSIDRLSYAQRSAAINAKLHADRLADLNAQIAQLKDNGLYDAVTDKFASDKDQKQYVDLSAQVDKEQTQAAVEDIQAKAQQSALTWSGALKQANNEWLQNSRDTASQIKEIYNQTVDGLNDNLSNLMTGQKTRWSQMFTGLSKTLATDALKQGEGSIASLFAPKNEDGTPSKSPAGGLVSSLFGAATGKADGSAASPFFVKMTDGIGGASSKGLGSLFKSSDSDDDDDDDDGTAANATRSFLGKIGSWFSGLFGTGHAIGGDVSAGKLYPVNEQGIELFAPSTSGKIIPHNAWGQSSGGSTANYTINVQKGVTPEEFHQGVTSALQQYHTKVMPAGARAAVSDGNRRNVARR